ncbi:hypothetical protein BDR07DRAFT_1417790 [Suillus spraguei]|nr:hypothetical protein BDR07DRAFT_1417790 [Suillus spraguei]
MTRSRSPGNVAVLQKSDYSPPVVHRQKTLQVKKSSQRLNHGHSPFHQKSPALYQCPQFQVDPALHQSSEQL